ncbi:STAS domain-containing protein [Streptomyces sp. NPDC017936]|uniref:STAS domain-containing protein n=1 Tax=Streptomyces sp. NPDC017936 TaxID=3365016 RepID=UPI00378EFB9E
MSPMPPTEFTLVVRREAATLTVCVSGELDYDTCDELIDATTENLTGDEPPPRAVRLDFRDLTWIDSSGLSALLMIHRRTSAVGAVLHLDHRPDFLERMLHVTNVLDHLTGRATPVEAREAAQEDGVTGAGAT